jgi:hypothetical protein
VPKISEAEETATDTDTDASDAAPAVADVNMNVNNVNRVERKRQRQANAKSVVCTSSQEGMDRGASSMDGWVGVADVTSDSSCSSLCRCAQEGSSAACVGLSPASSPKR